MPRQFIAAKFRKDDRRTYTYHFDHGGEIAPLELVPGDEIKVPDPKGEDGWKRVYVSHILGPDEVAKLEADMARLNFETKPALGRIEPEASQPAETPPNMGGFVDFLASRHDPDSVAAQKLRSGMVPSPGDEDILDFGLRRGEGDR